MKTEPGPALISTAATPSRVDVLELNGRYRASSKQSPVPPSPPRSRNSLIVLGVIVVFLVAGVGAAYSTGLFSTAGLTHKQTGGSAIAATATISASLSASTTASMPPGCALAKTVSSQGYTLEVYLSNSTKLGGNVCIGLTVQNVSGGAPSAQGITQQLTVTDSSGRTVTVLTPAVTVNGTLLAGHFVAGSGFWNSSTAYNGITPQAGTYQVSVVVKIPANGLNAVTTLTADADFTLTN